jgi:hypothetical protein
MDDPANQLDNLAIPKPKVQHVTKTPEYAWSPTKVLEVSFAFTE